MLLLSENSSESSSQSLSKNDRFGRFLWISDSPVKNPYFEPTNRIWKKWLHGKRHSVQQLNKKHKKKAEKFSTEMRQDSRAQNTDEQHGEKNDTLLLFLLQEHDLVSMQPPLYPSKESCDL